MNVPHVPGNSARALLNFVMKDDLNKDLRIHIVITLFVAAVLHEMNQNGEGSWWEQVGGMSTAQLLSLISKSTGIPEWQLKGNPKTGEGFMQERKSLIFDFKKPALHGITQSNNKHPVYAAGGSKSSYMLSLTDVSAADFQSNAYHTGASGFYVALYVLGELRYEIPPAIVDYFRGYVIWPPIQLQPRYLTIQYNQYRQGLRGRQLCDTSLGLYHREMAHIRQDETRRQRQEEEQRRQAARGQKRKWTEEEKAGLVELDLTKDD